MIKGWFSAMEGVQMHRKRVLTKFQVNLVIPKALFMVIFQPKEGICIYGGFYHIFNMGRGKSWGFI